jgi:N-acetylglucosaminyl-diphospho-decaprenol L-rhamnosyltransferase
MTSPLPRAVVDVGLVTWNTRDLTVRALRTLLDSDQGVEVRVLVRDNGSSDGTAAAIRAEVPEADVDAGTRNLGFGAGMNTLIDRSDAPWFFCLNSDAWPDPGALGRLVAAAEAHPQAAAVAPRIERPDGELEHSTLPFPSTRVALVLDLGLHRLLSPRRKADLLLEGWWKHDEPRVVDWAVGAALLFPRAALDDVGHFDERFFMYAEDLEWGWRAHRAGYQTWFEPSAVVRHVGNASGAQSYQARRTEAYLRNTHRFYRAAHGPLAAAVYRGLEAIGSAGRWLHHARVGERELASAWRHRVKVHLTPVRGADGPPSDGRPAAAPPATEL